MRKIFKMKKRVMKKQLVLLILLVPFSGRIAATEQMKKTAHEYEPNPNISAEEWRMPFEPLNESTEEEKTLEVLRNACHDQDTQQSDNNKDVTALSNYLANQTQNDAYFFDNDDQETQVDAHTGLTAAMLATITAWTIYWRYRSTHPRTPDITPQDAQPLFTRLKALAAKYRIELGLAIASAALLSGGAWYDSTPDETAETRRAATKEWL